MNSTSIVLNRHSTLRRRTTALLVALIIVATGVLGVALPRPAYASGSDYKAIDFTASSPQTYDHTTGGGAYDSRRVGDNLDVVEQLHGADFACNDVVSFLVAVQMNSTTSKPVQSAEFDLRFLANTTGRAGAAIGDIVGVRANYGVVSGGDGSGGRDAGMQDDGGSSVILVSKQLTGPLYAAKSELLTTVRVTDLEANEQVIIRIDARITCQPGSDPTGNLQASVSGGRVYGTTDAISVGNQTIPLLQVDDVAGTGEPLLQLSKTVTTPANSCKNSTGSLIVYAGEQLKNCYTVANAGTQPLYDVAMKDDNATPNSTADDFTAPLTNLQNLDGQTDAPDLGSGKTATGEAVVTVTTTGTLESTITVSGNNGQTGSSYEVQSGTDSAEIISQPVSTELTWTTTTEQVAYEDLKHAGWSDWDYNDLVVAMVIKSGVNYRGDLSKLVIEYKALARGANFNHKFIHKLPLTGGGTAEIVVRDSNGAVIRQERISFGALASFAIFDRTRDALPPLPGYFDTNTRATQPSIVLGHTATLTIDLDNPSANPVATLAPAPWDPYIFVYNTGEEVHLMIPGQLNNTQTVNGTYDPASPLLGYDLPLAQVYPADWKWPIEFAGLWRGYPAYVSFVDSGGARNGNWYLPQRSDPRWLWLNARLRGRDPELRSAQEQEFASRYFAAPVVADLEGDGRKEIIIGNLMSDQVEVYGSLRQMRPGWPRATGGGIKAAVAVADLVGDGQLEIIAGATDGKVYAWGADGEPLPGWPVALDLNFRVLATPAVGDINGDGQPEVVVASSNGKLYALRVDGRPVPGWPVSIGGVEDLFDSQVSNSSPRIADLNGDGSPEIVVGSTDRRVYALNGAGEIEWRFTTGDVVFSTPAVANIDPSSPGLEVAVGSGDSNIYLLDSAGHLLWKRPTGWTLRSSPAAADLDGDGKLELFIGSDDNKVWAWHYDGSAVEGWPQATQGDVFSGITVADVDGDYSPEIAAGSDDGHVYLWHANGSMVGGWPKQTSLPVKGAVTLVNLDGDDELEVVAADFSGQLYTWGVEAYQSFMPMMVSR